MNHLVETQIQYFFVNQSLELGWPQGVVLAAAAASGRNASNIQIEELSSACSRSHTHCAVAFANMATVVMDDNQGISCAGILLYR